jgi:hypothetical protein
MIITASQPLATLMAAGTPYRLKHDQEKCEAVFRKDHAQTTT